MTIGADGAKETKLRLTHDQSFNTARGMRWSVNDAERLTPAQFGQALLRFLHYTCRLRRQFPSNWLLITKVNFKSASRRVHLKAKMALKSSTCIAGMLLVALRMTFGGAPNPSQWSDISEVIADLANDLVRRIDWDPAKVLQTSKAVDNDEGHVHLGDKFGKAFVSVRLLTASASGGDHYGHWLAAAAAVQDSAFTVETRAQRDCSWGRFQSFLREIGHRNDPFLLRIQPEERVEVLTRFAAANDRNAGKPSTCTGRPHGAGDGRKAGTVRAAINAAAQTYRANTVAAPHTILEGDLTHFWPRC